MSGQTVRCQAPVREGERILGKELLDHSMPYRIIEAELVLLIMILMPLNVDFVPVQQCGSRVDVVRLWPEDIWRTPGYFPSRGYIWPQQVSVNNG